MGRVVADEVREEVRSRVPLEDLVREYSVALQPSGGHRLRALCPFHHEKTPSFYVNSEKQFYHCFGCKESGDVFTFIEKMDHVGFPEALEILARRAGVELRHRHGDEAREGKVVLFDALELAAGWYHKVLLEDPRAEAGRRYLVERRISREMWIRFRLGWSLPPPDWDGLVKFMASRKVGADVLERAGLARRREGGSGHYDYFRGRVMFPISDPQKRVVGFGARSLGDEQPKYLNTPKTAVFEKGQVLYALPQARQAIAREGRIAIMEGYTDAIMAHQEGVEFAVASLGTAFTAENAKRLRRLVEPAPRIHVVFDGDAAGQGASERSLDLLVAEDLDVRIFSVTTGKDPCDALLELGGAEFRRRLEADSMGIFEFKYRRTVQEAEARGEGPTGIARALDGVLALLARVPNVVARKLEARRLAERLGLDEGDVEARLARQFSAAHRTEHSPLRPNPSVQATAGGEPLVVHRGPSTEEVLIECLLTEPELARDRWLQIGAELRPGQNEPAGEGLSLGLSPGLSPGLLALFAVIERRATEGSSIDGASLLAALEDDGARQALLEVLARLEGPGAQGIHGDSAFTSCVRELERKALGRRLQVLEREREGALRAGDRERHHALERERYAVLRRMKNPGSRVGEPIGDEKLRGDSEKGIAS